MKKSTIMMTALLLLQSFAPVCCGIALAMGWEFLVTGDLPFFAGSAILTVMLMLHMKKEGTDSRLAGLLFPLSVINGLVCLWVTRGVMGVPSVAIQVICCGNLFRELVPPSVWKKLAHVVSVLLVTALVLLSALELFVGAMSRVTVVREAESPEGTYTAQLIDADYGATGGDTLIWVYDNSRTVHLGPTCLTPAHQEVYRGNWGEFVDMTLSWQDDNTLLVNEKAYPVG